MMPSTLFYRRVLRRAQLFRQSHSLKEEALVRQRLGSVIEPITQQPLGSLGIIEKLACDKCSASITLQLLVPGYPFQRELSQLVVRALSQLSWIERVFVDVAETTTETKLQLMSTGMAKVKHVIAISSCKGNIFDLKLSIDYHYYRLHIRRCWEEHNCFKCCIITC